MVCVDGDCDELRLDGEILPLLLLPGGEDDPDGGELAQPVPGVQVDGVLLQVELFDVGTADDRLHLHVCNEVLLGVNLGEGGDVEKDGGEGDEGVAGDAEHLQLAARAHLTRQR